MWRGNLHATSGEVFNCIGKNIHFENLSRIVLNIHNFDNTGIHFFLHQSPDNLAFDVEKCKQSNQKSKG